MSILSNLVSTLYLTILNYKLVRKLNLNFRKLISTFLISVITVKIIALFIIIFKMIIIITFIYYLFSLSFSLKTKQTLPLNGRSAILGEHQNNCFVDVKCGRGQLFDFTYVLTKSGLLIQFNKSRELEKLTDIKSKHAFCLEIHTQFVMCGCTDGVIRLFNPLTLDYIATMPRPHPLGINLLGSLDST